MSYRDRAFCPKSAKDNSKCLSCNRFFNEQAYHNACDKVGNETPILWLLEPPCEKTIICSDLDCKCKCQHSDLPNAEGVGIVSWEGFKDCKKRKD